MLNELCKVVNSTKGEQKRMENTDEARQQAQRDHTWGQGPANTNGWNSTAKEVYEAERARLQKQQQEEASKNRG